MTNVATLFRKHARDYGIVFTLIVLVVILSSTTSTFLTQQNLVNLFDQIAVVGILSCGVAMAMIAGVFDLSTSAIAAVSAIISVDVVNAWGLVPGLLAGVACGVLLGLFNGLAVTYAKVNSFIATLASSIIFRGLALVITGGAVVSSSDLGFSNLTSPSGLFGITYASWALLAVAVISGIVLAKSVYGRTLYAVGGNAAAARISGIGVGRAQTSAFMISGACAALAGIVLASRSQSAQASMGTGIEFTAIAAVVIGGVSLAGGQGSIWRAIVGVVLLQLISNGFNLLGLPSTYQQVVQGVLILVAVAVDQLIRRRRS